RAEALRAVRDDELCVGIQVREDSGHIRPRRRLAPARQQLVRLRPLDADDARGIAHDVLEWTVWLPAKERLRCGVPAHAPLATAGDIGEERPRVEQRSEEIEPDGLVTHRA